ncbi:MAG: uncharacterized protein PWR10_1137 [Halanaerobiales bacterium]|nr:uncharacterized protein [Halanaerobiales bacterium]
MEYRKLGDLETRVSELCFGALPMGPLQKDLPVEECKDLIIRAIKKGINFIDTAQLYRTYEPIGRALRETAEKPVIATKSTAITYQEMMEAYREATEMMGIEVIDIFHLHAARVENNVFEKREGALECLKELKQEGKIKAIGISSHSVPVIKRAAIMEDIDIVFPILNKIGMGIISGNREEMEEAIQDCISNGKGIYLMKVLAGGNLINDYDEAMTYARSIPGIASIAVGMVSLEEIDFNIAYFNGKRREELPDIEKFEKRVTIVKALCKGCGTCLEVCPNEAIAMNGEIAEINDDICLTCGYCVHDCPEFAIRVI